MYTNRSVIKRGADKGGKERNDSEESGCTKSWMWGSKHEYYSAAQSQPLLCVGQCETVKDL